MARPQKENGFTPVAHEILEQICQYTFNGAQYRIVLIVWRMTYGYNRKDHDFSNSFIQETTRLSDTTIKRELSGLIKSKVLIVTKGPTNSAPRRLAFNKNYDEWLVVKSGDPMVKQLDLFSMGEGPNMDPQAGEGGGPDMDPPGGSILDPLDSVLGGQDRTPYKEIKILKKSFKEKESMFEQFFSIYPRKANKAYAIKTWEKHCKDESFEPDIVIAYTRNFIETCQLIGTEMKFIPHASTYLNQYRYNDYETVDPEGLSNRPATEYDRDKEMLQQMMREAEEREGDGRGQALLNHPD